MSHKLWVALGVSLAAYFAWRASQWRVAYSSGVLTPWGKSLSLALSNPLTDPRTVGASSLVQKGTTASAGDGTGKSGPTIVSIAYQKPVGRAVRVY